MASSPLAAAIKTRWSNAFADNEKLKDLPGNLEVALKGEPVAASLRRACENLSAKVELSLPAPDSDSPLGSEQGLAAANNNAKAIYRSLKDLKTFHALLVDGSATKVREAVDNASGLDETNRSELKELETVLKEERVKLDRLQSSLDDLNKVVEEVQANVPDGDPDPQTLVLLKEKRDEKQKEKLSQVELIGEKKKELSEKKIGLYEKSEGRSTLQEQANVALAIVDDEVRTILLEFANRRRAALDSLETAAGVVSEAAAL